MGYLIRLKFLSVIAIVLIIGLCVGFGLQGEEVIFRNEDDSHSEVIDAGCNTPNGYRGECVDISSCPFLLSVISKPDQHEFLRQANCGWNESIPMVCCDTNWNCSAPDNKPGLCVPFQSCPDINKMITQLPVSQETITHVRNHRCGSEMYHVCCTSLLSQIGDQVDTLSFATNSMNVDNCEMTPMPPDPLSKCCGYDISSNRIVGGEATSIDQYPWTAAIEYLRENVINVKCGGTLISGTYVVTAAHCIVNKEWTPLNVVLGEYDIDNPGMDCVEVEGGGEDCTDEPVIISIAKTISHPGYNYSSRTQANDIALIKLQETAPYTDFIRPICLPTTDFTETTAAIDLRVVGWGATDEIRSYSPIKLHVQLPFVNQEDCFTLYRRLNIILGEGQICAGGEIGKDSCKGDSGGALMLIKEQVTEIVGIISFGYLPCGLPNKPAVYTKIYHYLPWIRNTISQN